MTARLLTDEGNDYPRQAWPQGPSQASRVAKSRLYVVILGWQRCTLPREMATLRTRVKYWRRLGGLFYLSLSEYL